MPLADIQVSFSADASALQDSLSEVQAAVAVLQQGFADTSAVTAWSQAVAGAAGAAASSVSAAAETMQTGLTTRLDPIGASAARLFSGLTLGGETWGEAFLRMGDQLAARFVGWTVEMAERWAVNELAQTAATAAGATARSAATVSADAAGMAASGAQALGDIGNSAARAAAGAYAAVASTPVVGPVLAPAAAATALAAALEFGGQVVSAAGGWGQVPYDGAPAVLHKDEMVLPASIASPLRAALGGPGEGAASAHGPGSGGAVHHHWNIQAVDAQSFARLARSNPDAITGALAAAAQRLTATPDRLTGSRAR
jgi:hypothetical protein